MNPNKVTSADGTPIAYEQFGDGPPLVLVCGAFNNRQMVEELAVALGTEFTAVSYDRRGRGDSGDTQPYAVEREIEDLAAVIQAVGGTAFVYGMSSGAVLSLRAAAAGVPISRLSVLEPPFRGPGAPPAPENYVANLREMTSTGRPGDAAAYFMTDAVGLPQEAVDETRKMPIWPVLEAMAPTLIYDALVMDDSEVPTELLARITIPTLAVDSTSSPAWLRDGTAAAAESVPNAKYRSLEGSFHNVPPEVLLPALAEFFLR